MNIVESRDAVSEFDRRLSSLDEAQSAVEGELKIEHLEGDIDEAAEFRDKARVSRVTAKKVLASRIDKEVGHVTSDAAPVSASGASAMTIEAKLLKLERPIFTGDVAAWMSFWKQCQAVRYHQIRLPAVITEGRGEGRRTRSVDTFNMAGKLSVCKLSAHIAT